MPRAPPAHNAAFFTHRSRPQKKHLWTDNRGEAENLLATTRDRVEVLAFKAKEIDGLSGEASSPALSSPVLKA